MVDDDDETSKDKEIDKLMALISLSFKKIYKPTNNNLRTSSNTSRANQDNSLRIIRNAGYESQRSGNVAGARETVGSSMVPKSGIQCYNCKEFGHVARELEMNYDSEQIDQNDEDADLAKEQLKRRDSIEYVSEMELACAKVREMKNKLSAHQDTISIVKQQKDAQIKLYKSCEDKEIEKVIDLENKVKVLDNIVY
nr:hypothetical protein [Tanacetum cinerariifolium]